MPSCKKCRKTYEAQNADDGYCCFDCWEEDNCGTPTIQEEETITVNDE